MRLPKWWLKIWGKYGPARKISIIEQDRLPDRMPPRDLVLTRDDGDDWSVGMLCPCGCGDTIELMVVPEVKPRWSVMVDKGGLPSLHPSVWRQSGCRSHFWIRQGKVFWCD